MGMWSYNFLHKSKEHPFKSEHIKFAGVIVMIAIMYFAGLIIWENENYAIACIDEYLWIVIEFCSMIAMIFGLLHIVKEAKHYK